MNTVHGYHIKLWLLTYLNVGFRVIRWLYKQEAKDGTNTITIEKATITTTSPTTNNTNNNIENNLNVKE